MIVKKFNIPDLSLNYFIGINQISIEIAKLLDEQKRENQVHVLDFIFDVIEQVQNTFKESTIQFFSQEYVLDQNHIFNAAYFMEKAFLNNLNISNKKNIEFLLYLATNRQIRIGIEAFGIKDEDMKKGVLLYCIISHENNVDDINKEIVRLLRANEVQMNLTNKTFNKFNKIKTFFEITNEQIITVLKSHSISNISYDLMENNLEDLYIALNDLICEKMTLLSLEKIKSD